MAFHKVGVTSNDFIKSLTSADKIAKNITSMMRDKIKLIQNLTDEQVQEIEVFPYSVFYVFYEQYLTVWKDTVTQLAISIVVIFIVTALLLGLDFYTSAIITLTITMIIFNLFGAMYLLDIELNAVSLVNLVMVSFFFKLHFSHSNIFNRHSNRQSVFLSSFAPISPESSQCQISGQKLREQNTQFHTLVAQ